jgi:hypothetical protein
VPFYSCQEQWTSTSQVKINKYLLDCRERPRHTGVLDLLRQHDESVLVTLRVLDYRLDPRHVQQAPMRARKQKFSYALPLELLNTKDTLNPGNFVLSSSWNHWIIDRVTERQALPGAEQAGDGGGELAGDAERQELQPLL